MPLKERSREEGKIQLVPVEKVKEVMIPPPKVDVHVDFDPLAKAIEKLSSGRKRVVVRVLDRDREGRPERVVFDVFPVED